MIISIIAGILTIVGIWFIMAYNAMVKADTEANDALANLDVFLLKRLTLTTQLIASVKKYIGHENEALLNIVKARNQNQALLENQAASSHDVIALSQSTGAMSAALPSIFALTESYPDLKASNVILNFQDKVSEIENDLEGSRRYYNATVRVFNEMIRSFPTVMIVNYFDFAKKKEYFNVSKEQKESLNKIETL